MVNGKVIFRFSFSFLSHIFSNIFVAYCMALGVFTRVKLPVSCKISSKIRAFSLIAFM